jgi:hypothetical protein
MSHYYINFNRKIELPWGIHETSADRKELVNFYPASAFELNVPSWSFIGKYHYLACDGVLSWDGTKAIINLE